MTKHAVNKFGEKFQEIRVIVCSFAEKKLLKIYSKKYF